MPLLGNQFFRSPSRRKKSERMRKPARSLSKKRPECIYVFMFVCIYVIAFLFLYVFMYGISSHDSPFGLQKAFQALQKAQKNQKIAIFCP